MSEYGRHGWADCLGPECGICAAMRRAQDRPLDLSVLPSPSRPSPYMVPAWLYAMGDAEAQEWLLEQERAGKLVIHRPYQVGTVYRQEWRMADLTPYPEHVLTQEDVDAIHGVMRRLGVEPA